MRFREPHWPVADASALAALLCRAAAALSFVALAGAVPSPWTGRLQAQPATLVERVRRRSAGYERGISDEYLAVLAESYARFFYHYDAAPLLIVNSENLNFVERDADFELLVSRVRRMKSRREFFNVG